MLESLTKSSRSSRNVMLMALVLIGAVAAYNWIITPHLNYLQAAQRYELTAENHAKKNKIVSSKVEAEKKELAQLRDRLKQVSARLFDPQSADKFFSGIQTIAQTENCQIYSSQFSKTDHTSNAVPSQNVVLHSANLEIAGSYGDLVALMDKLQDYPQQVNIDLLKIESAKDDSDLLICDAVVEAYVIQDKEIFP